MKSLYIPFTVLVSVFIFSSGCQKNNAPSNHNVTDASASDSSGYIVVTANPHATNAGKEIIEAGGSAVDAAIAIQSVLSLVEPQSSGLAGGAFMMHYDASEKNLTVYDGRERAPKSATKDMFLKDDGTPFSYLDAKNSGLSVGVPSAIAMLEMAHNDFGKHSWKSLFGYAKALATNGFSVSPRLHNILKRYGRLIPSTPEEGPMEAYNYFHIDGEPLPVGHILKNPDYAEALDIISADPSAFYKGSIAEKIVAEVARTPRAGAMTLEDLSSYKPQKLEALCSPYREMLVCGPPPPSSWIAVSTIMSLLDKNPFPEQNKNNSSANWQHFINAQRLAYADRDHFIADPEFSNVPIDGLLNSDYIAERAKKLSSQAPVAIEVGNPWKFSSNKQASLIGKDATNDVAGTSHFVVVDKNGDAVSMTTTVESIFGSSRMVGGMFLNNQLTDFSFRYQDEKGLPIANAVHPGKRPRSSMSPTIILDENREFLMATGSPGGSNIIAYTAKSIVGVLDWGLTPQQAVALPNVVARGDIVRIEANTGSEDLVQAFKKAGYNVDGSRGENSGLSMAVRKPDGSLVGGVDPRREGTIGKPE
ncbi:gamma-glutamyltransferase family protein [Agarilytica rhodophyticola]|uniref:gamma-glutamyltransferase family protein n=1 Tax=Agarilytica rhodophyticola TaxID=1737490 RepID=UPI000B34378A|nr:gamma-glutamyltransferase family protein [Agarilytica rhodophyticola]